MAGQKDFEVGNAFSRIAAQLQTKTAPKVTPYEQTNLANSTTNVNTYQYNQDKQGYIDKYKGFEDQFDTRGPAKQAWDIGRRAVGAFGELVESTGAGVANLTGAINSAGVDDVAKTAYYKMQDQNKNQEYQQELDYLSKNPTHALTSGFVMDQRELEERKAFLQNRMQQNMLTQDEHAALYNPDGSETEAKQRLNWSASAEQFGKTLGGDKEKGTTGFLNAGNWYSKEGSKAYAAHKKWNGTDDNTNKKLVRDAQDAYNSGDMYNWASKHLQAFGNSAGDTAKALVANPAYALEETAAMLPYLIPHTRGLALGADAARIQDQSHDQFTQRELRTPTTAESLGILGMTAAYTGLNYAEAVVGAGALKGKGALTSLGLKASRVTPAVEKSVINSMRNNAFAQATGRIAGTMAVEGVTEAGQQQIESNWGSLNPNLDPVAMGEAFTMGATIGGILGGPGNVASAATQTVMETKAKAVERSMKANPETDPRNSTADLANPNSPKFNAEAAAVRMTQEAAKAKEENKPEDVEQKLREYEDMVSQIRASQETLELVVDMMDDSTPYDTYKVEQEAVLAEAIQAGDKELIAKTEVELGRLNAIYDAREQLLSTMDETAIRKKFVDDQKALEKAEAIVMNSKALGATEDVNPTNIPSTVLNAPSALSPADLAKASNDVKYSAPEKEVLRKLSEARQAYDALQDISKVTKDVFQGSSESKPLMEYLDDAGKAVTTGNERLLSNTLRGVSLFAKSHLSKLDTANKAMELSTESGKPVQIFRTATGWAINDSGKMMTGKERKENAALEISPNRSERLIAGIRQEAEAIVKTKDAVETLVGRKHTPSPVTDLDTAIANLLGNPKTESLQAQELVEQGVKEQAIKAKAKPVNTPTDPTQNNWEGMESIANQSFDTEVEAVTERNDSEATVTQAKTEVSTQPTQQPKKESKPKVIDETSKPVKESVEQTKASATSVESVPTEVKEEVQATTQESKPTPKQEVADVAAEFSNLDTTVDYDPTYETKAKANAELKAVREAERAKPFNERNLVKDSVMVSGTPISLRRTSYTEEFQGKSLGDIQRVLLADAKESLGTELEPQQVVAVKELGTMFYNLSKDNTAVVLDGYAKDVPEFKNFAKYLMVGEATQGKSKVGVIDPKVQDAIAVSAFTWISENGKTLVGKEDVLKALFFSDAYKLPNHIYQNLKTVGTYKNNAAQSMGSKIVDTLGYSFASDVAPERKDKLTVALGHMAVHALIRTGYLEEVALQQKLIESYVDQIKAANTDASIEFEGTQELPKRLTYVRIPADKEFNPKGNAKRVLDANRGSKSVINKMFGVPSWTTPIKLSAPKEVDQKTIDSLGTQVPEFQVKALEHAHKLKWTVSKGMHTVHEKLKAFPELRDQMYGKVSAEQLANTQAMLREGIIANNQAIDRDIHAYEESLDLLTESKYGIDQNFYLQQEVWVQQRSGMVNAINPVASKLHRGLVNLRDHEVSIAIDRDAIIAALEGDMSAFVDKDGITPLGEFIQAVALNSEDLEPEGVSTTADKTQIGNYAPQYLQWMLSPASKGVDALISMSRILNSDNVKESDVKRVADTVAKMGMGAPSLKALVAMAKFRDAFMAKEASFTSDLAIEIDGVTNGPFLTQVMLNTLNPANAGAGGLYKATDGITNVPQYKDAGRDDMYEHNAKILDSAITTVANKVLSSDASQASKDKAIQVLESIKALHPKFTERKGAKTLTTVINFAAGGKSTAQGVAGDVLDSIIGLLGKAEKGSADHAHIVNHLNTLLSISRTPTTPVDISTDPKELMFTYDQEKALLDVLHKPLKAIVTEFTSSAYLEYVQVRDQFTAMAQLGYEMFMPIYMDAIETAGLDLEDAQASVEGISKDALRELHKELRDVMPSYPTAMGLESGNTEASSIPMVKSSKRLSKDPKHMNDLYLSGSRKVTELNLNDKGAMQQFSSNPGSAHIEQGTKYTFLDAPGVRNLPMAIHSQDAYIAHAAIGKFASMNVHDALSSKVGQGRELGQFLNKTTFDSLVNVDANVNFITGALKPLKVLGSPDSAVTADNKEALTKAVNTLGKSFGAEEGTVTYTDVAVEMLKAAYARDINKLMQLREYGYLNQYGLEGGEYKFTDADYKHIDARIKELEDSQASVTTELVGLATVLDQALGFTPKEVVAPKEATIEKAVEQRVADNIDMRTVDFYLRNVDGPVSKSVLFSALTHDINKANKTGNLAVVLAGQMFNLVKSALPDQLDIQVATSTTPSYYEHRNNEQYGWIDLNVDGKPTIYMMPNADGVFDTATLLHELLHAATAIAVRSNDKSAKKAVAELETLREQFAKFVAVSKIQDAEVEYALSNVDEFIATVFSEPKVANLLNQMRIPKAKVSGLNKFIKTVSQIVSAVFGKPSPKLNNEEVTGLEALMLGVLNLANSTDSSAAYDLFGPSSEVLNSPKKRAVDAVKRMNTLEVALQLNGSESAFDGQVLTLLDKFAIPVLDRLDDPFLNRVGLSTDPTSVWADAIANNTTTTQDGAVLSGFKLTERERFATELLYVATKGVATDRGLSLSYAELTKTFNKARGYITPESFVDGSWKNASKAERDLAQAKWDYLFKITPAGDHIARFTSMVLGSAEVHNVAAIKPKVNYGDGTGIFATAEKFVREMIERIGQMIVGAKVDQTISAHVSDLTRALAKVDLKQRNFITNRLEEQIAQVDEWADKGIAKLKEKVAEKVSKSKAKQSDNAYVGVAADVIESAASNRLWQDMQTFKDAMFAKQGKLGFWRELVNEIGENSPFKDIVEKLKRQVTLSSQQKELLKEQTRKNLIASFKDGGANLTKERRDALTMMLRADVQSLSGNYSTAQIAKLYDNATYRNTQINNLVNKLKGLDSEYAVTVSRAKDLARYMVTGLGAKNNDLAQNPMLIAMRAGTANRISMDNVNSNTVEAIDQLVSLYAIQYTDASTKAQLAEVFAEELGNNDNGVDTMLKFHKYLADDAKAELFKENPLSAIKGYVPEITNPNHEIRFATTDEQARNLKEQFFREVKTLEPNVLSNGQTVRMFLSEDAGQTRLVSGTLELTSSNPKGTPVSIQDLPATVKAIYAKQGSKKDSKYDPFDKAEASAMIPRYGLDGSIIGFTYQMSSASRDALLQRNNNFEELLGQYAATNYNKVNVPASNELAIDAIVEQYDKNYDKNPRAYIEISPTSRDPELRMFWQMLPQATRDYIRTTMGDSKLIVQKDVVLPLFGFKKYSVINGFDKGRSEQNLYEKVYIAVFKTLFGNNARAYGARFERGMQEAVSLAKNIIVIRNVRTLVMNIMSNTFLLQAHGISLTDIVKDTVVSLRAGMQHRKDNALLIAAQQKLYAGVGNKAELEQEVMRLSQAVASNPLAEFINEGMLPSIVDDVALNAEDDYGFKSAIERKFDKQINKIPKTLRTVGSWLMVSPKTPLYEFLNNTTQLSDFTAKYVMYKYYAQSAPTNTRTSHDEAIKLASENFVNYDMPTSKGLQYLNDTGIVMFTKYNLRIQRALFKLLQRKPARALLQALVMHHGTDIPFGIDPIVWNQLGFPLRDGALILPDALGEPIPISTLRSIF